MSVISLLCSVLFTLTAIVTVMTIIIINLLNDFYLQQSAQKSVGLKYCKIINTIVSAYSHKTNDCLLYTSDAADE